MKGIVFDGEELRLVEGLEVRPQGPGEVTVSNTHLTLPTIYSV